MIPFIKRFFSDEALFQRSVRGLALGGVGLIATWNPATPINWRTLGAAGLAAFAGMVAAPTKAP